MLSFFKIKLIGLTLVNMNTYVSGVSFCVTIAVYWTIELSAHHPK